MTLSTIQFNPAGLMRLPEKGAAVGASYSKRTDAFVRLRAT
ncbi:MAG: hypothetical protein ABG776_14040 [Cyanobacteria bacterium J06555_13]